jgi:hypothetical protein
MESISVEQGVVPIVRSGKGFVSYRFVDGVNLNKANIIAEAGKAANARLKFATEPLLRPATTFITQ